MCLVSDLKHHLSITLHQSPLTTRQHLSIMPQTMKQVINYAGSTVKAEIKTGNVPTPDSKQVLIKVIVSGSNPKDWKVPEYAARDSRSLSLVEVGSSHKISRAQTGGP